MRGDLRRFYWLRRSLSARYAFIRHVQRNEGPGLLNAISATISHAQDLGSALILQLARPPLFSSFPRIVS